MNEQEYVEERYAIEVVADYILHLEEILDHLGIVNGREYYTEAEANEVRDALVQLT